MNDKEIRKRLEEVLHNSGDELNIHQTRDIAFHMTDWINDLSELVEFYESPDKFSDDEIYDRLLKFCIHAPAHIMAAAEIFLDKEVKNIFKEENE